MPFFRKIQDWILKSKNGFCVCLLNRLIQDNSDNGASKEPKNPCPGWIFGFLWRTNWHHHLRDHWIYLPNNETQFSLHGRQLVISRECNYDRTILAACRTFVLVSPIRVCMSVNKHSIVYSSCVVTDTTVESLGFEVELSKSYFLVSCS